MASKKGLECEISLAINNDLLETCKKLVQEKKQLQAENEKMKEELEKIRNNKCVDCISHLISKNHKKALIKASKVLKTMQEIKAIVLGDYEMLDPQALQEIRSLITKAEEE